MKYFANQGYEVTGYDLENKILGRILLGKEGINGAVSATDEAIKAFKKFMNSDSRFSDITFREQTVPEQTYHKLVVRVRKEIVTLGVDADLKNTGNHIEPEELPQIDEEISLSFTVNSIEVMESELKRSGAQYNICQSTPLQT